MRDLIGDEFYLYQGFFEKASEIASYYGIKPIDTPMIEDAGVFERTSGESSDVVEKELYPLKTKGGSKFALRPEFTAGVMRSYMENGMRTWPQPVMLYSYGPVFRHDKPQRGRFRDPRQFNIEIIGTEKSMADVLSIHVVDTILKESGLTNIHFEVNSIGDRESRAAFQKELTSYYRKHVSNLTKNCGDCLRRLKTNPLRLLDCKNETCVELREEAPVPMNYLNATSKKHFKEVLEYLEALGIEYTINNHLVRGLDYYSQTVFEIFYTPETKSEDDVKPLAIGAGGRYDYLAKQIGNKKEIPAVGVALGVDRILMLDEYNKQGPRIVKKPKVFFVQLGYDAKLKSMTIVEILRKAKIPINHSLSKDSLSGQLATAEKLKIPYTMILGQKEVLDDTVIIRDMVNRSQKVVKTDKIADYFKNNK